MIIPGPSNLVFSRTQPITLDQCPLAGLLTLISFFAPALSHLLSISHSTCPACGYPTCDLLYKTCDIPHNMPSASSSRSSKPKPAEVAAETKRFLRKCAGTWPARAILYAQPCSISHTHFPARPMMSLAPPVFCESPTAQFRVSGARPSDPSLALGICGLFHGMVSLTRWAIRGSRW